MTDPDPNPSEINQAEAARRSREAGIADESAAYVNGGDIAAADDQTNDTADDAEQPEAHPS